MFGPSPAAGAYAPRLQASLRDTGLHLLGVAPPSSIRGLCCWNRHCEHHHPSSTEFIATVPASDTRRMTYDV
ncbi:hypothetical protein Y032_0037g3526 [Ancylostoma ceylanicum]|uniref:Uncharacterized protein n=1 Tax=Ancylostoma ceylanicum TaxID=53326 RepID=A0A016UKK1_9BILA|nr:hypothetical protein Y032_0037g3526 [Ancylostoma ceylanicum]